MNIRMLFAICALFSLFPLFHSQIAVAADSNSAQEEFEGRKLYPTVKWITLSDLHARRDQVIIVDARSKYEFNTLHIKPAINIPVGSDEFDKEFTALHAKDPERTIVCYCNGHACMKSYQAVVEAHRLGFKNVVAYDAGVFEWARKYPEESVLLGKSPLDLSKLIPPEKLAQHTLSAKEFEQRIGPNSIVIDIRDMYQQEATALFPLVQHSVPLDNGAIKRYVDEAKRDNKTLLIYDATGNQVAWLQYYLEDENVPSYYFLKGGAEAYYDEMIKSMSKKGE